MPHPPFSHVLFDWGGTLMSESGPPDVAMACWPDVKAVPGAEETLARLAPRHRLCVATNASISSREQIAAALDRASLWQYISEIFCFTELGVRKESPEFWATVTSRLAVTTREIAMIGDSLEQDVMAPRRCGIFSIWFNEDGKQGAAPPDVPAVHRLPQVVPLVGGGT